MPGAKYQMFISEQSLCHWGLNGEVYECSEKDQPVNILVIYTSEIISGYLCKGKIYWFSKPIYHNLTKKTSNSTTLIKAYCSVYFFGQRKQFEKIKGRRQKAYICRTTGTFGDVRTGP